MTGRLAVLMVAGFAGMIGCAADPVLPLPVGPADPNAIIDRTQITAEPNQVAPGDIVALRFPDEMIRGVWFVLEERVDDTWIHRYNLTSDGPGPKWERKWYLPNDLSVDFADIGVMGPGPDRVVIPPGLRSGEYRVCTGNAGREVCAVIEVVGR